MAADKESVVAAKVALRGDRFARLLRNKAKKSFVCSVAALMGGKLGKFETTYAKGCKTA
jgi:hypothetical protein